VFPLRSGDELRAFSSEGNEVDAALVDLSPIADDPDAALTLLRACSPGISIFLISGTSVANGEGSAVAGWIRKPFELSEIFQALSHSQRP
jgi:hypothetical protein